MRKQDRIQQQKNQGSPGQQGQPQSAPRPDERMKGGESEAQPKPPRRPGQPLPIPD